MPEPNQTDKLLTEIRDILAQQTADNQDYLTRSTEYLEAHKKQSAEEWRQFRSAHKQQMMILGLWLFIIVSVAVLWATSGH